MALHAHRLLPMLFAVLVLCFGQEDDIVSDFTDPVIAAAVQPIDTSTELGRIVCTDLPRTRPPFHTPQGWKMCDYSCASNISVRTAAEGNTKGVLELDVSYKPIPSVNSTMMMWLFENLNGTARYSVDNKTYPMYLIFHPVDHQFHKLSSRPIRIGTRLIWCEIALTGCRYNRNSASSPYFCPPKRRGFTRSSNESAWNGPYQSKIEMIVSRFDAGGIEFYSARTNALLGSAARVVGGVRHTWRDSPRGLLLRTYQWVGLMKVGSITEFDESGIGALAKGFITRELLGGATPATNIQNSNMTQLGWLSALHFLQEYAGVGSWLPQVYAGRRSR